MGIIILLSIFIIAVVMTVKEIKEGMTAPEVAQTIKENFDALNTEKETVGNVGKLKESVDNANKNTGVSNYPAFSATEDVAIGVVRNYNGLLYRSIVAGANEWNEANWERVSLESLQNEKLTELASEVRVFKESSNREPRLLKAGILNATKEVSLSINKENGYEYFIYFGTIINNGIQESKPVMLYRQKEGGDLENIYNLHPNLETPEYARTYSEESVGFVVLDITKLDGSVTDVSINRNSGFNLSDKCFGNTLPSFYEKTNKNEDKLKETEENVNTLNKLNGEAFANSDFSNKQYPWMPGSIWTDGSFRTYSSGENWMRTDYILIKDIQKIYLDKVYVNQYISPVAFYSQDKTFISAPLNSTTTQQGIKAEIDVPENAFYVAFTSKQDDKVIINFNSGISLLSMANRTRIENAFNDINRLKDGVILKEKVDESSVISSLNAYAYGYDGKFFTNQYTGGYYYYLFKLAPNTKYVVKQKEIIENTTMMSGFLESESQFVVGGKATPLIIGGQVGEVNIDAAETERLFVLLGEKADSAYGYSELYSYTKNLEDSIKEIEESIKDLEDSIKEIDPPKLCCPDTLYAVVGKEFNLYYDSLIKGLDAGLNSPSDIYIDIQCPTLQTASANIGVRRERMWQIQQGKLTSIYIGEHSLQITAYDNKGNQIDRKIVKLLVSNNSSLASQKNILCIGDSLTNNGPIVATCAEHFNASGGVQPNFVGQRTTYGYKHEGYPGYSFYTFVSSQAGYTYKIFDVPNTSNVAIEDKYSTNGTVYIVKDIRVEGLDNALRLRCEKSSGSNEPTQTGILTKVSGQSSSDASIEYLAFEAESGSPFWDNETNSVNFTKYREKMGMGNNKFDIVVIMLGTNDCIGNIKDSMQGSISNAKTLINAILADAADYTTKIVLQITPADANTISSWQVYADSNGSGKKIGYWNNLWNLRHLMYDEFTKEEWNGKVYLGQAALGLDRYYGYPYTEVESSTRISNVKEVYHTNSVHPNKEGYQQLGDGYYLQIKSLL